MIGLTLTATTLSPVSYTHLQLGSYFRIMLFNAMIDWGQIVIPIDEKHLIL